MQKGFCGDDCADTTAVRPATVTGRFAPTPSGRMHLGNVFSALLAWLSVRSAGGRMVLRIEDLDLSRTSPEYTRLLMEDLEWLGLFWDEEAPNQSACTAFYEQQLAKLAQKGLLYPCFCSRAQLHAATAPHAGDGSYVYDGRCRNFSKAEAEAQAAARPPATRVRVPDEVVAFCDGVQGHYQENLAQHCGDFIPRRSDGVFAYQLAAPANDGAQGVTEVVRGADLLPSTPRQIWLMRTLGYTPPRYCHVPLLLAPDGRRLSKRDEDLDLGILRRRHKTPHRILGVLAQLAGLLPKARPVAAEELIPLFDWSLIRKQNTILKEDML